MSPQYRLLTLALACATGAPLSAAESHDNAKLEEVIVTSSRVPMPLRQVATSVSVITQEDIDALGYYSLLDVLRNQASVGVSNSGGTGKPTALRIRGEEGFRTRAYLDGIDISDTSGPQISPRFEHLLSAGLGRVEILRGPQGLAYGADAGGVVNIQSRRTREGFSGSVGAEAGRYGTRVLNAAVGGGNDVGDFNLSASDLSSDGFNSRRDDTILSDDDGYDNTTLHGRGALNVSDRLRLELVALDIDSENEFDNCYNNVTFALSAVCDSEFSQKAWRVSADYRLEHFNHNLTYTLSETDSDSYSDGLRSFGAKGEHEKWSYLGDFKASDALRLIYGAELQTDEFDDGSFDRSRDQTGYFAEYQGGFGDTLFVTAGARYDDNDDFGDHVTWRLSGAWLLPLKSGELKFKSAWGTGFRAPSLYEIAYNRRPGAYPPASETELSKEESEGVDLGVEWYGNNGLYLEAVLFHQTVTDEIYFDLAAFSGYIQDRGDTESRGIELIGEMPLGNGFRLYGNYTYNDTETADGSTRIRRPEHLANIGLEWLALDERLRITLHGRGSWNALANDGTDLDDYQVVDLKAGYELLPGLEIYGRVENALNEDYEEVKFYNTSSAAAYAGIKYTF